MQSGRRLWLWMLCAGILLYSNGCEESREFVPPPPPPVTVQQPRWENLVDSVEFTGNTQAVQRVELRARINGYLQRITFEDGDMVKEGDVLFVIEPAPFEAVLAARLADLEQAKAAQNLAQIELQRTQRLQERKIAAQQELDQQRANAATARAQVAVAQAAVTNARLDLSYTQIRAPISGRISQNFVDAGNLVQAQQTLLATIVSIDPIYAYFYISESDLLRFRQMIRQNELPNPASNPPLIRLGLANEEGFPHEGRIDFRDLGVDPDTGTILLRAIFPNPQQILLPGLFVRLQAPVGEPKARLMIDARAIATDQRGHYVLTVNDANTVEYHTVQPGLLANGMQELVEGVAPEAWIIVNGLQRARPGATVQPQRPQGEPVAMQTEEQGRAEATKP